MKGRMSWPALTIAAAAISALAPSTVDAQQEQLFPNLWIQRQRVPPPQEKPLYGMYRNRYYGYFPTCWRRFPPGWGCPSPEVPDWEAEVERNPVDLGEFGPDPFDGTGTGLGPLPGAQPGPAPGAEPLPELPDEGRSLFERDPFAPEMDDQPEPELRQPQQDPFENEPPDPFQDPFENEPPDPFSPDAPQTSAPPAAPMVIPPLRDADEAVEVGQFENHGPPPSPERDLAAIPDLNTRPASRPPDFPAELPAVDTAAPGDFVLPPPGALGATESPRNHHHHHRVVPDRGRRLGGPLPAIDVSEPTPGRVRSQPAPALGRARAAAPPRPGQRAETQPRRKGPIRQFFSGLFDRRVRR